MNPSSQVVETSYVTEDAIIRVIITPEQESQALSNWNGMEAIISRPKVLIPNCCCFLSFFSVPSREEALASTCLIDGKRGWRGPIIFVGGGLSRCDSLVGSLFAPLFRPMLGIYPKLHELITRGTASQCSRICEVHISGNNERMTHFIFSLNLVALYIASSTIVYWQN